MALNLFLGSQGRGQLLLRTLEALLVLFFKFFQAPLSMGFSRPEYWSELPFPSPGDLPDPGSEPRSPALQARSLLLSHQGSPSFLKFIYF